MVGLDEVARTSGVSRATASRALNGDPHVRNETRERVIAVAEALGYRPNRAARRLASGRSNVIGFVLPSDQLLDDPYGALLLNSVALTTNARDHGLMLWMTHRAPGTTVAEIFRGGLVDGLLMSAVAFDDAWVEELLDGPLPTMLIGRHPSRTDLNVVEIDNVGGARRAVEHLLDLGHRRIAHIAGPAERADARERRATYEKVLAEHGVDADPRLVEQGGFTVDSGVAAMVRLLPQRPTAVFASNDEMAFGAYEAIAAAGLEVPGDISIVGFDDFPARPSGLPPLTTVRYDLAAVAQRAVDALLALIDEPREAPRHLMVPAELHVRQSTRVPRGP
ncbi:MAG: LacI family DNA-binding transcriptional regulator [Actinomycetota bacterium]|nr:LacI family DNA-binding transcriptional regulator [Actinomycetota bacterium]